MKLSNEMKQVQYENIVYLATSTQEGKSMKKPAGLVKCAED